jgi:hypothetical protein
MKMPKPLILLMVTLGLLLLSAAGFTQGRRGQPQTGVFYTDVPEHPFGVILARPTWTTLTLSLLAYQDMEGMIAYGTQKGTYPFKTETFKLSKNVPAQVVLSSLHPDTRYYYRLNRREPGAANFAAEEECSFHTARPAGGTFTFTVQADSHLDENSNPEVYARTLANALASQPDFHIDLGDTFMTDKYRSGFRTAARQYLDGIVCQLVPQPGHRRFDNTRSAQEYEYVRGDILSAPGMMRIAVSEAKATVEYVRTYLAANERDGRKNGQVAYSYSIAAPAK